MKLLITTMKLLINTDLYQYNHNLCFNSSGGGLDSYLDNWNSSREKNLFLVNLFAAEELIAYKLSMINQRSWRLSGVIDKECCKIAYGEQHAWLGKQHSSQFIVYGSSSLYFVPLIYRVNSWCLIYRILFGGGCAIIWPRALKLL